MYKILTSGKLVLSSKIITTEFYKSKRLKINMTEIVFFVYFVYKIKLISISQKSVYFCGNFFAFNTHFIVYNKSTYS